MKFYQTTLLVLVICKCSLAFSQSCNDSWSSYGTNCYKVIATDGNGINWFDAQKECENLGSNLVSIHDFPEQVHIAALVNSTAFVPNLFGIWIGLNRTELHSYIWQWTDGTLLGFSYWSPGDPSDSTWNSTDGEACAHLYDYTPYNTILQWNDQPCNIDRFLDRYSGILVVMGGYVCKINLPAISTTPARNTTSHSLSRTETISIATSVVAFCVIITISGVTVWLWRRNRDNSLRLKMWRIWGHVIDDPRRPPPPEFVPHPHASGNSKSEASSTPTTQDTEYITLFSSPYSTLPVTRKTSIDIDQETITE